MAKQKHQSRKFSGMGYREIQQSNSIRRSQLSKSQQIWLKENGYKNIGWDNIIQLYQKINEFFLQPDGDEDSTLEELFLKADHIGHKYQTEIERETFNQQMAAEVSKISDLIDQQFPETEVEVIDFGRKSHSSANRKKSRKKYR